MPTLSYDVISDLGDVSSGLIDRLAPQYRTVAGPAFSNILERSLDAKVTYLVIRDSGSPVALVYLVETTAALPLGRKLRGRTLQIRLAVCGHPIICADCGIAAPTKDTRDHLLPQVLPVISQFLRKRGVAAVLMKDTTAPRTVLERAGYWHLPLEPVMGIAAVDQWAKFDDYLAAMRPDHRRKVRSARTKVENNGLKLTIESELSGICERLHTLYVTVASRPRPAAYDPDPAAAPENTRFPLTGMNRRWSALLRGLPVFLTDLPRRLRVRELNQTFFTSLAETFPVEVDTIALRDQTNGDVRAYTMNIQDGTIYHSLFIGMNYTGDTRFIYRTLLSAKIERAIERGVRHIEFGRTSLLTKSELGAQPQPAACYVRLLHPALVLLNPMAKSFFRRVPAPKVPHRRVFRSHPANGEN